MLLSLISLWALSMAAISEPVGAYVMDVDVGADTPLPVHIYAPEAAAGDAPVILVMHGARRNGDDYRDNWIEIAEACGVIIAAPEFSRARFPGSEHYNLGGLGSDADAPKAFDMIEPIFAAVRDAHAPQTTHYSMFGHSAGSQFVHRYVLFKSAPHLTRAVAANAGWYTVPMSDVSWPYGLHGAPVETVERTNMHAPMIEIHLGENDNDAQGAMLRQTPEAQAQGSHRLARGLHMAEVTGWPVTLVPGADHNNALMAPAAARALLPADVQSQAGCLAVIGQG